MCHDTCVCVVAPCFPAVSRREAMRAAVFDRNVAAITAHNAKGASWTMAVNEYADMTAEEFGGARLAPFVRPAAPQRSQRLRGGDDEVSPPDTVATSPLRVDDPPSLDWSAQGAVSPVKDQGNCGSWYAFASVGAVESMHFIKAKYLQYLSEQQVVDCSGGYGNLGCKGGLMDNTYQYLIDHKVCRV